MGSRETIGDRSRTHGMTNTRLYGIWCGIKDRCYNPNLEHYDRYGGRGITVCDEWKDSFASFMEWAFLNGYDPLLNGREQSLDRKDPDGNYSPDNCRWVSMQEQARNRTDTVYVRYNGELISAREFTEKNNISDYVFVFRRVKKGQSGEKILYDWNMIYNTPATFMRVKEAAILYGVTEQMITKWIKSGILTAEKCGKILFIPKGQDVYRDEKRDNNGRFLPGHNNKV